MLSNLVDTRRRAVSDELEDLYARLERGDDVPADEPPLALLSADDAEKVETEGRDAQMLIEGLLPARGFNPFIGDSGLGKSPLLLQLAACVASGTPFLGLPVTRGNVLVVDHENQGHLFKMLRATARAIGVDYEADVKPHLTFLPLATADEVFRAMDSAKKPFALVIVDALSGFCGGGTIEAKVINPMITEMTKRNACWVVCHHVRKEDRKAPPSPLDDLTVRVVSWLQEASGTRTIINQAFTRIAIAEPKKSEAALILRANVKGRGDVGPYLLERIFDADEETPLGYRVASDWSLLSENERTQYRQVAGKTLSRAELKESFGDKATRSFLEAATAIGLVEALGRKGQPDRRYKFKPLDSAKETLTTVLDCMKEANA